MKHIKLFEYKKDIVPPSGWKFLADRGKNSLFRKFIFEDFKEAFEFITEVAAISEKLNHHPWWCNVYNEVEIKISTHDAGYEVTEKDVELAEEINKILG